MAKKKSIFECQHCGLQTPKWIGKCTSCGAWDSFIELSDEQQKVLKEASSMMGYNPKAKSITTVEQDNITRYSSDDYEFDLVLGGGIVPGGLTLIGGSPGVGKSTLLLKIAGNIARQGKNVLYVSGEESSGQIKLRADRLGANEKNLYLLPEIKLEHIFAEISLLQENKQYDLIIIDSIQTIYSEKITSAPGSVSQVREITFELMRIAKENDMAVFIIGHITKDGSIAGPRVLEHMVDTVLYFEGDTNNDIRMLRGFKNRFGSTSEIGIFEMSEDGLKSAKDIGSRFFNFNSNVAGATLGVTMEGTRALIVEVQALVSPTSYPTPKRVATGFDTNRLTMLLALLEKKLDLPFNQYDVFVNISGGIKIKESSIDLCVISAIISSFRNRPISKKSIFIGEVSLTGEIKEVSSMDIRLREAQSHGITKAIVAKKPKAKLKDIKCFELDEVSKVIDLF
jgi:DNA repair protein RadA/Sms